jgi:hypothetical protein
MKEKEEGGTVPTMTAAVAVAVSMRGWGLMM